MNDEEKKSFETATLSNGRKIRINYPLMGNFRDFVRISRTLVASFRDDLPGIFVWRKTSSGLYRYLGDVALYVERNGVVVWGVTTSHTKLNRKRSAKFLRDQIPDASLDGTWSASSVKLRSR